MLKLAGENCERIMGRNVRNVKMNDIQADEIWGFVQKKEAHKRPAEAHNNSFGDAYTFVAIERDSKLVLNFALGRRDTGTTQAFIEGLRDAIAPSTFQISRVGFRPVHSGNRWHAWSSCGLRPDHQTSQPLIDALVD